MGRLNYYKKKWPPLRIFSGAATEVEYMFTDVKPDNYYIIIINYLQLLKGKPVCLVCATDVAVMKECN